MDMKVLMIDDDPSFREMVADGLKIAFPDISLDEARDAYIGEKRLAQETYDLILLDYRLPFGMSGIRFLEKTEENRRGIPLIMITGSGNEEVAAKAFRLGVTDYLVKRPGLIGTLTRIINEIFSEPDDEPDEVQTGGRKTLNLTSASSGLEFIKSYQNDSEAQLPVQNESEPKDEHMEEAIMVEFEEANEFNKFTSFTKRMKGVKLHDVRILDDKFVVVLSLLPGRFSEMGKVFTTA